MEAIVLDRFVPVHKSGSAHHPAVAGLLDGETVYDSRYIVYEGEWTEDSYVSCRYTGAWHLKSPDQTDGPQPILLGVDNFLVYFHDTGKIYRFYTDQNVGYQHNYQQPARA